LKWFMFGIVFLVLWIWICTMKWRAKVQSMNC
jgi:Na+-transporting methylmalonyl-CoA/oxaloacetate decarboxylase gamma subunit